MSSTNRGGERQPDDLYVTPDAAVRVILPYLGAPMRVLDPACGDGALLRAARAFWHPKTELYGIDIVDRGWEGRTCVRDALTEAPWPKADLILANFPYSYDMEFVLRSLAEMPPGGTLAYLMRLAWMAGKARIPFHKKYPSDAYVLSRRPCFTAHLRWKVNRCEALIYPRNPKNPKTAKPTRCHCEAGHDHEHMIIGSDSADYAWFVHGPGRTGMWKLLDCDSGGAGVTQTQGDLFV